MKATSKQEFFDLLGYELNRIGIEYTEEIFADFEEHFADSAMRGIPESETADELGDIKEIARSYLNLESSRLNSILARDVERNKISLTKPGYSVPADLSLVKNEQPQNINDILNSDNIRSITPEHITEEIYPHSNPVGTASQTVYGANSTAQSIPYQQTENTQNAQSTQANQGDKTVGDAFSEAGKAAAEAARVTGHAIAQAFSNGKVKSAVTEAGRTAKDAVKTAGVSARDAINKMKMDRHNSANKEKENINSDVAQQQANVQYGEKFTDNQNTSQNTTFSAKKYTKISDFKGMKSNVNSGKLAVQIILDVFVWSWLLPLIASGIICFGCLGIKIFASAFRTAFWTSYSFISEIFLFIGMLSGGAIITIFATWFAKVTFKLIRYIIVQHCKAIYNVD